MKFVREERDIKIANDINEEINEGNSPIVYMNDTNKIYQLAFKVTDLGKANNFIGSYIMNPKDNDFEEATGIKVTHLCYNGGESTKQRLREALQNFINTELQ